MLSLAYKRQALVNHPDRLPTTASQQDREEATRKFQLVADAYYILGDRSRREAYDKSRRKQEGFTPFNAARPKASTSQANHLFGDIFEELLKPDGIVIINDKIKYFNLLYIIVEHPTHIWRIIGAGAGAILGFIMGNVPGAAIVSVKKNDEIQGINIIS